MALSTIWLTTFLRVRMRNHVRNYVKLIAGALGYWKRRAEHLAEA